MLQYFQEDLHVAMATAVVMGGQNMPVLLYSIIMSSQGWISAGIPDRVPDIWISKEAKTLLDVFGENDIYLNLSQEEASTWLMGHCDDMFVTERWNAEVNMDAS